VTVYRHISGEKAHGAPVSRMCELLGVSTSGYYEWAGRVPSDRQLGDAWLIDKIKAIHEANRRVYGAPRVHAELGLHFGVRVGRKRVERLMREAGLSGLVARKRGRTTLRVPSVRVADDLVGLKAGEVGEDAAVLGDLLSRGRRCCSSPPAGGADTASPMIGRVSPPARGSQLAEDRAHQYMTAVWPDSPAQSRRTLVASRFAR
jgi:transposase InsO family protein